MLVLLSACASSDAAAAGSLGGGGASSPARARRGAHRRMLAADYDAPARRVLGVTRTWTRTRLCGTPRDRLLLLRRERRRRRRRPPPPRRSPHPPAPATPTEAKRANATNATSERTSNARPEAAATTNGVSGGTAPFVVAADAFADDADDAKNTTPTTVRGRRLTPNETVSRPRAIVPIVRRSEPRRPWDAPRASVAGGVHGEDGGGVERDWRGRRRGARRGDWTPPPPETPRLRRRRRRPVGAGRGRGHGEDEGSEGEGCGEEGRRR